MTGSGPWFTVEHSADRAAIEGYQQWIDEQKDKEGNDIQWMNVTFKVRGGNLHTRDLQRVLKETIKRFQIKVLGGNAVQRRGDRLRFLPVVGGDHRAGVLAHVHGRLEFRTQWSDVHGSEFVRLLDNEWKRQLSKVGRAGEVWAEHYWTFHSDRHNADEYAMRDEGTALQSGTSKVDTENLYLV